MPVRVPDARFAPQIRHVGRILVEDEALILQPGDAVIEVATLEEEFVIDPEKAFQLVGDEIQDMSMRVMDLITPMGMGQRALLVAPPAPRLARNRRPLR